ncbi:MAG: RNA polymerase sigma factor [Saprospiraceae bacterium]
MSLKNFGLSEEDFKALLIKLKNGDDKLFEHVFLSHFDKCVTFIVKKYNTNKEEAHDVTMDTLLLFRRSLLRDKISYGNMEYLFTLMAKQVLFRKRKQEQKQRNQDLEAIEDQMYEEIYPFYTENETLRAAVERAWKEQKTDCNQILTAVFFQGQTLKELALTENLAYETLKKRRQRCLNYLRTLVSKYFHD